MVQKARFDIGEKIMVVTLCRYLRIAGAADKRS
jgi:hypothetical protein